MWLNVHKFLHVPFWCICWFFLLIVWLTSPCIVDKIWGDESGGPGASRLFIGLVYRKPLILPSNMGVSCKFSHQPTLGFVEGIVVEFDMFRDVVKPCVGYVLFAGLTVQDHWLMFTGAGSIYWDWSLHLYVFQRALVSFLAKEWWCLLTPQCATGLLVHLISFTGQWTPHVFCLESLQKNFWPHGSRKVSARRRQQAPLEAEFLQRLAHPYIATGWKGSRAKNV